MNKTIYGTPLPPGHCHTHPDNPNPYPCPQCVKELNTQEDTQKAGTPKR